MTEVDLAAEAAVLLGAEQARRTDASGYVSPVPDWLHEAVDAALPEHLGFGRVEGVLLQRGPAAYGGYRIVQEAHPRSRTTWLPSEFVGLDELLPVLAAARVKRLLREAT